MEHRSHRRTRRHHRSTQDSWDVTDLTPSRSKRSLRSNHRTSPKSRRVKSIRTIVTVDLTSQEEKCPICFYPFIYKQVCTPNTCNHAFCIKCLQKWSENTNTCPIDRKRFTTIHIKKTVGGATIREIDLELMYCDLCGKNDSGEELLTCETCMTSYHSFCLSMSNFSEQEWLCADCGMDRLVARTD